MGVTEVRGMRGLAAALRRDLPKLRGRMIRATRKAAIKARPTVAENVPVAFAELRGSIHVEPLAAGALLVADAPHAAAVEVGSRPHFPPLEPILKWVKLRGMQGLDARGRVRPSKAAGSTTAHHSYTIAAQIRRMRTFSEEDTQRVDTLSRRAERRTFKSGAGAINASRAYTARATHLLDRLGSTNVDVPMRIARAIQQAIGRSGTKPSHYMQRSLPTALRELDTLIDEALHGSP